VYQQIHGKAAEAILSRFMKLFENVFPTPDQVLEKNIEDLRSAGLSTRKTEYIRDLATKFNDGTITPDKFTSMSPEDISTQLCSVKGIGQWTVDMFLMHDLHHSDILPLGDLAVRKGVANHFGIKLANDKSSKTKIPAALAENSEIWRPYRTIGSVLMWRIADTKTVGDKK
jgi:DNA-3-methyladenine glycosylase II